MVEFKVDDFYWEDDDLIIVCTNGEQVRLIKPILID